MRFDRGVSIGLFLFSLWVVYLSVTIHKVAFRQVVGPEVMPIGIALALMVASVLLFRQTLVAHGANVTSGELTGKELKEDRSTQGLVILGIVVYIFALEPLGYVISTALLCIYETAVFEPKHWVRNILVGIAFAVVVYTIFVKFLAVLLPVGLLGW